MARGTLTQTSSYADGKTTLNDFDDAKSRNIDYEDEKAYSGGSNPTIDNGWADDHPAIKDLPLSVRRVVSLEDDPSLPTLTFRYFALTLFFVIPGAFLSQMSHYRTTYAPYSIFFVQIASDYVGQWLAKALPSWNIKIPFTKFSFNLNPGPWSVKEHVLVTLSAASGATYNLAYAPISIAELYFEEKVNPILAIVFMWSVVWTGYSFAAISRQFLLYDPQYPWF
ncbi:Oligopeptide transporter 1, partial [Erysiphe necator]